MAAYGDPARTRSRGEGEGYAEDAAAEMPLLSYGPAAAWASGQVSRSTSNPVSIEFRIYYRLT